MRKSLLGLQFPKSHIIWCLILALSSSCKIGSMGSRSSGVGSNEESISSGPEDNGNSSEGTVAGATGEVRLDPLTLAAVLDDGYLNATERANDSPIVEEPTGQYSSLQYGVVAQGTPCGSTVAYTAQRPTTNSAQISGDGVYKVCVKAGDGNSFAFGASHHFIVDTIAPVATLSGQPSGTTSQTSISVQVGGTGVVAYHSKVGVASLMECADASNYGSSTIVATPISGSIASMANGLIKLCVLGIDQAGNVQSSGATVATWTKSPPAQFVSLPLANAAADGYVNAGERAGGANLVGSLLGTFSTVLYRLVPSAAICDGALSYSVSVPGGNSPEILADGSYKVCARLDAVGGTTAYGASPVFSVDTVAPSANLAGHPTGSSTLTDINVSVSGSDVTTHRYKVGPAGSTDCSNPSGYGSPAAPSAAILSDIAGLADGLIKLCVVAADVAGNEQILAATWTKTAPAAFSAIALVGPLSDGYLNGSDRSSTAVLVGNLQGTFASAEYALVAASTTCNASVSYTAPQPQANSSSLASDGSYKVCVKLSTAGGTSTAYGASATFIVDTSAPTPMLGGNPSGSSSTTALQVNVSGSEVATYKYKVGVGGSTDCASAAGYSSASAVSSPLTTNIAGLNDGAIKLCVIGIDAAGNEGLLNAASATWTKIAPVQFGSIALANAAADGYLNLSERSDLAPIVGIPQGDFSSAAYKTVSNSTACDGSLSYGTSRPGANTSDISGDGSFKVCVQVTTEEGTTAYGASASFTVDTVAPSATISGQPTGASSQSPISAVIGGTGVSTFRYLVGPAASLDCTVVGSFSAAQPVSNPISANVSGFADGLIKLCVMGSDSAGNWQSTPAWVTWTKSAPVQFTSLALVNSASDAYLNLVERSGSSAIVGSPQGTSIASAAYRVVADSVTCGGSVSYGASIPNADTADILGDGRYKVCVKVTSAEGSSAYGASAAFEVDTSAPMAIPSGQPSGSSSTTSFTVSVSGSGISSYKYKLGAATSIDCASGSGYGSSIAAANPFSGNISSAPDGLIRLCVLASDLAGNDRATEVTWTKAAPALFTSLPLANAASDGYLNVSDRSASSDLVGDPVGTFSSAAFKTAAELTTCDSSLTYVAAKPRANTNEISADGTYKVCARLTDAAGGIVYGASATFIIDTTAPTASLLNYPTGSSGVTSLNVTVAGSDVTHYTSKVGAGSSFDCGSSAGYSSITAVATPISTNIASLADGEIKLCVRGIDSVGNQNVSAPTSVTWTKVASVQFASIGLLNGSSDGYINAGERGPVDIVGDPQGNFVSAAYKVVLAGTSCDGALVYSASKPMANTSDISSDGTYKVCVKVTGATGNVAYGESAPFVVDSAIPTAILAGQPTGSSSASALNVTVSGADVTGYKYKLGPTNTTDCSNGVGFSSKILVANPITDSLASFPDGSMKLCVRGTDVANNEQSYPGTTATWTKASAGGSSAGALAITAMGSTLKVAWTATTTYGYLLVRRAGSAPTWTPANGTEHEQWGSVDGVHEVVHNAAATTPAESELDGMKNFSDTDLQTGTRYYYSLYIYDSSRTYTLAASGSGVARAEFPVANSEVLAVQGKGDTIYLGGGFSRVGAPTGSGVIVDKTTAGKPAGAAWPVINGAVLAAIPDPMNAGGYYIGGTFTKIGGVTQKRLARIRPDGSLDTSWRPKINGRVNGLAVLNGKLFVGGRFFEVNGEERSQVAAFSLSDGSLSTWSPDAAGITSSVEAVVASSDTLYLGGQDGVVAISPTSASVLWKTTSTVASSNVPGVVALAVSANGSMIYVGGGFSTIGGQPRSYIASLAAGNGAVNGWNPGASNYVFALAVLGTTVYAGGAGTIGSVNQLGLAALDGGTGQGLSWTPISSYGARQVYSIVARDNLVWIGGDLRKSPYDLSGQHVLVADATTGTVQAWDPAPSGPVRAIAVGGANVFLGGDFSLVGGDVRKGLAAVELSTGRVTEWNPTVTGSNMRVVTLAVGADNTIYAGGYFSHVKGQSRLNLAAISPTGAGDPLNWVANANAGVRALLATSGKLYVGGDFTSVGNSTGGTANRTYLALLDSTTAAVQAWAPTLDSSVSALALSGTDVIVGGYFTSVNGQPQRLAKFTETGTLVAGWAPVFDSYASSVAVEGDRVFVGGWFTNVGGVARNRFAALNASNGQLDTMFPSPTAGALINGIAATNARVYLARSYGGVVALDRSTGQQVTDWAPGYGTATTTIFVAGDQIIVSGWYNRISGLYRSMLAAIDTVVSAP